MYSAILSLLDTVAQIVANNHAGSLSPGIKFALNSLPIHPQKSDISP